MNRQERDNAIIEMAKTGLTYHAIGQHFGLTRERVRQLLKAVGIDGSAMRSIRETQRREALEADQGRILEWVQRNPGLCIQDAEEALMLESGRVREALGTRTTRIFTFAPRNYDVRYTDEDIFEALRSAAILQGDPRLGRPTTSTSMPSAARAAPGSGSASVRGKRRAAGRGSRPAIFWATPTAVGLGRNSSRSSSSTSTPPRLAGLSRTTTAGPQRTSPLAPAAERSETASVPGLRPSAQRSQVALWRSPREDDAEHHV